MNKIVILFLISLSLNSFAGSITCSDIGNGYHKLEIKTDNDISQEAKEKNATEEVKLSISENQTLVFYTLKEKYCKSNTVNPDGETLHLISERNDPNFLGDIEQLDIQISNETGRMDYQGTMFATGNISIANCKWSFR